MSWYNTVNDKDKDRIDFINLLKSTVEQLDKGENTSLEILEQFAIKLKTNRTYQAALIARTASKVSIKYVQYVILCARRNMTAFSYESPYWTNHYSIIS